MDISVMTYNVQMWQGTAVGWVPWETSVHDSERCTAICTFTAMRAPEIVVLNESWANDRKQAFINGLMEWYPQYKYVDSPSTEMGDGLVLLAKTGYTIIASRFWQYSASASPDSMAQKGLLGAYIEGPAGCFAVFATHLQAGGDSDSQRARAKQIDQVRAITQEFAPGAPCIILGDLNVNANGGMSDDPPMPPASGKQYLEMMSVFDDEHPVSTIDAYASKWKDDEDTLAMSTVVGKDHKRLDYVLVTKNIDVRNALRLNCTYWYDGQEYAASDHFPVEAELTIPLADLAPGMQDQIKGLAMPSDGAKTPSTGNGAGLAFYDGVCVEIHRSQDSSAVWARTGKVSGNDIEWGDSDKFWKKSANYIALTTNKVGEHVKLICVRCNDNNMHTKIGTLDPSTQKIVWGAQEACPSTGRQVAIAMNTHGHVVEVHRGSSEDKLWYRVGFLKGDTIEWSDPAGVDRQFSKGQRVSLAIDDAGNLILAYTTATDNLRWRAGKLDFSTRTVWWGSGFKLENSCSHCSVTMNESGDCILVARKKGADLVAWSGKFDPQAPFAFWKKSHVYGTGGGSLEVAIDPASRGNFVEFHIGQNNTNYWARPGELTV